MWGYVDAMQEEEEENGGRWEAELRLAAAATSTRLGGRADGHPGRQCEGEDKPARPTLEARYTNSSKTAEATNITDCQTARLPSLP